MQRELGRVESFQSEHDIVAHIDQLRRKVKRNAREEDEKALERKSHRVTIPRLAGIYAHYASYAYTTSRGSPATARSLPQEVPA